MYIGLFKLGKNCYQLKRVPINSASVTRKRSLHNLLFLRTRKAVILELCINIIRSAKPQSEHNINIVYREQEGHRFQTCQRIYD